MEQASAKRVLIWLGLLVTIAIASALLIYRFAQDTAEREVQSWQSQLSAEAYAQAQLFNDWVAQLEAQTQSLAQNNSVRLYLSTRAEENDEQILNGQQEYLRNLLTITAENLGLNVIGGSGVKADRTSSARDGLALIDNDGNVIAALGSGQGFEASGPALQLSNTGQRALTLQASVFPIQGGTPLGSVILTRAFDEQAQSFLSPKITRSISRHHYLAEKTEGQLRTILGDTAGLIYRIPSGSGFSQTQITPNNRLIGVSAPIDKLNLELLVSVSEKQVLTPIYERRNLMMTTLGLSFGVLIIGVLLAWRHGASVRVERALKKEEGLRRLFKLVADKQPTAVLIVDEREIIVFANAVAAKISKADASELSGKTLNAIFGPAASQPFSQMLQMVGETQEWSDMTTAMDFGNGQRLGRLLGAPLSADELGEKATVLIWDDLTDVMEAQKRKEKSLEDLTALLTGLIDARDPYSAAQGAHIAELSKPLSEALEYDPETRSILALSSKLLNLGKVLVPREILIKASGLSSAELKLVHEARAKTTELLKDINFDAPVLDIIQDATGLDEAISGPAAVLRMMNDFVSMVSPRAHRDALDVDAALEALKAREGFYDKASIAALIFVLEYKQGRDMVAHWQSTATPLLPAL